MAPSSGELWGHQYMPQLVTLDCLLPNGVIVSLNSLRESPLHRIKADLWLEARNYPLFHLLQDQQSYIFVSVTRDAEREEFHDESRRLCDLRLFQAVLKLVEPKGNKEEKVLNSEIGAVLGVGVHEFDDVTDEETHEARRNLLEVAQKALEERCRDGKESQLLYAYPPEVENTAELPVSLNDRLVNGHLKIAVWSLSLSREKQKFTVAVKYDALPSEIVREAIFKRIRHSEAGRSPEEKIRVVDEFQSSYVLKVAGSDQYLVAEYPISQYKYVRRCMSKGSIPQLALMSRKGLVDSLDDYCTVLVPAYMRKPSSATSLGTSSSTTSIKLWHLDTPFRIHALSATYVNVKDADQIYVRAGIFHGMEALCEVRQTKSVSPGHPRWDEWIEFEDMFYTDLPRAAKLCISICAVRKRGKNRGDETTMLCWGNVSLFDWKGRMLTGKESLNLWGVPRGMDDLLNPLGCSGSNPVKESPCLEIDFGHAGQLVFCPDMKDFRDYVDFMEKASSTVSNNASLFLPPQETITEDEQALLKDIAGRDPLAEISEQDKVALWRLRKHCLAIPDILPRFLDAVKWNSRDDQTQLYLLLEKWPAVSAQRALELLDCKYADPLVRSAAVRWLDTAMSDEDMAQYLMQLVQTLKYEPYRNSPLAHLLLRRALLNRKIGHFFFWHLRSELTSPWLIVRFGLLLEAYCRGLGPQLKDLMQQVEAIDKLTNLTDSLKEKLALPMKERMKFMVDKLSLPDYAKSLKYFRSPLENTVMLGDLDINKCKVMDSAKKPLWLVWKNPDELSERVNIYNAIIFKNGDDLRQDMLTLQVISIMDCIWHHEGMDLRMTPYTCLATGHQVGMIQVVRNAKTVYQIQRKAGKLAAIQVDSTQLYKWIREHNRGNLADAIKTFSLSCAGYCVATFILGIGDRHPDNIMVNEQGQIFHIDFGHFLGHFKKKFGINRERVPFVLTDDFLFVISNGKEYPKKSEEFARFQELCGKAYLSLRKHANLLITLFTMMLPTGITELQSINDVGYLRQTLAVEKTEEEALEYFQSMFYDAYGGAWTTKLDWFFHSVRHGV